MGSLLLEAGEALVTHYLTIFPIRSLFHALKWPPLFSQELPELCDRGDDQSREVTPLNRGAG